MYIVGKTSIIKSKNIGRDVTIGEFCIVEEGVTIGDRVKIHDHVIINNSAKVGDNVEIFPFCYLGKEPKGAGTLLRKPNFSIKLNIGNNSVIGPHATIYYDVTVGNNTLIGDNASIRELSTVGNHCIIARNVTVNYNAQIGDFTKIMDGTHITGNSIIGKHVFIGPLVSTSNDNSLGRDSFVEQEEIGPTIEDFAMIGEGASLLPKVRIGKGSIVGAGSVVTKDVGREALVMGIPARYVRSAID